MGSLFALMSAFCFSVSNILIRKGTTPSSKNNGAFVSMLLTALISGLIFIGIGLSRGWPIMTWKGLLWFIIAGVLTTFLGRTLLYSSIQHLGSVRATAIKRLNPFFAVILGVLLLNEPLSSSLLLGMSLIFLGFALLIYENYRVNEKQLKEEASASLELEAKPKGMAPWLKGFWKMSYLYGPLSALCYAFGYVSRKIGLSEIQEPFFGTFLGAGVGILIFVIFALFKERYRIPVVSAFTSFQSLFIVAGICTSFGQIFYFLALSKIEVSRVALIASVEVVITILLSALLLRKVENLNFLVIFASLISMVGAMVLAMG